MRIYIELESIVIGHQISVLGIRLLIKQKVDHIPGGFASYGHGFYAGNAIYHHVLARHLACSHFLKFIHLFHRQCGIKIISAAHGFCPAELRFDYLDIHLSQEAS